MVVSDTHKDKITSLLNRLEEYDNSRPEGHPYPFHEHSKRVAENMKALAKKMGYDDNMCDALYWATLPHDIGKTALPLDIWDRKNKPTDEEKTIRRTHAKLGADIIKQELAEQSPFASLCIDLAMHHHETFDKKGPLKIDASTLSQEIRMLCICDAFDGWSIKRPHFEGRDLTPEAVLNRMETEKSGQFDPAIFKIFKEMILCQSKPSL